MKNCITMDNGAFPIRVDQQGSGKRTRFTVTYGLQVKKDLGYAAAAHEFGECVFHMLACESKLDNEGAL